MHIVSWNVAGWKTTVDNILTHHKFDIDDKLVDSPLENWLRELDVDILCLQEVKMKTEDITNQAMKIGARSAHYDAFFCAPNTSATSSSSGSGKLSQTSGGLNGVATYVRKGLTVRANSRILDNGGELDAEGRCLMTDHGLFVIFNVYVPNGGGGRRLPYKQKFLKALEQAMDHQRTVCNKYVILVGDLNIHYRAKDCNRLWRSLDIQDMLSTYTQIDATTWGMDTLTSHDNSNISLMDSHSVRKTSIDEFKNFMLYLEQEWPPIEKALLDDKYVEESEDKDGKKNIKLKVKHPHTKKDVVLKWKQAGGAMDSSALISRLKVSFRLDGTYVNDKGEAISKEEYLMETAPHSKYDDHNDTDNIGINNKNIPLAYQVRKEGLLDLEDFKKVISDLCSRPFETLESIADKQLKQERGEEQGSADVAKEKEKEKGKQMIPDSFWEDLSEQFGCVSAVELDVNWLKNLLYHKRGYKLVDAFAVCRDYTVDRFTVWGQYTNDRYRNEGTRIDFTLVDEALWNQYGRKGGDMDGYSKGHNVTWAKTKEIMLSSSPSNSSVQDGREVFMGKRVSNKAHESLASFRAATNFNDFRAAAFDGGGIPTPPEKAYVAHLRRGMTPSVSPLEGDESRMKAHTGIIYTPPEYSDHVAVSVFLDDSIRKEMNLPLALEQDTATKTAQPHQKQSTMSSFFTVKGKSNSADTSVKSTSLAPTHSFDTLSTGTGNKLSGNKSKSTSTSSGVNAKKKKQKVMKVKHDFFSSNK